MPRGENPSLVDPTSKGRRFQVKNWLRSTSKTVLLMVIFDPQSATEYLFLEYI